MARKAGSRGWGHIRKLPSGNLQASYLNRGRRHNAPTTFTNSKAGKVRAEGWLADERALIEAGTWTPPADRAAARTIRAISLHDYAVKWIADRPVKPRTRLLYESQLKHHIKPTIGAREVTAVTPEVVRSWYCGPRHRAHPAQLAGLRPAACGPRDRRQRRPAASQPVPD